jgi:hypothetical protein
MYSAARWQACSRHPFLQVQRNRHEEQAYMGSGPIMSVPSIGQFAQSVADWCTKRLISPVLTGQLDEYLAAIRRHRFPLLNRRGYAGYGIL